MTKIKFNLGQRMAIDIASQYYRSENYDHFLDFYSQTKERLIREDPEYFKDFFIGKNPHSMFFGIQGAAGTGKTTIASGVLDIIKDNNSQWYSEDTASIKKASKSSSSKPNHKHKFLGAALSHAAKQILQSKLDPEICGVTTIASYLQMTPYVVNGEQFFRPVKFTIPKPIYDPYYLVTRMFLDEASMLGPTIIRRTEELSKIRKRDLRYICLLDPYQLPPIEKELKDQGLSPFCDIIGVRLNEIMRYNGDIAKYSELLKEMIDANKLKPHLLIPDVEEVTNLSVHTRKQELVDNVCEKFKEDPRNPYQVKVGAYRNKVVESVNAAIRKKLFGEECRRWEKGDWMILNEPCELSTIYFDEEGNIHRSRYSGNTGEYFIVERVVEEEFSFQGVICSKLWVSIPDKPFHRIEAIVPHNNKDVNTVLKDVWSAVSLKDWTSFSLRIKELKKVYGQWVEFLDKNKSEYYSVKNRFCQANHGYALTLHKLQGSTINHQWVLLKDVMNVSAIKDSDKLRALYVGATRAKDHLYLMG